MLFQPHPKKFPEGNQELEPTHMARPQQSTIAKASISHNCNSLMTYGPEEKNLQSTNNVKSEVEVEEDNNLYP